MTELMSWKANIARWRVVTAEPGQDDTFVATFIEGKFAYLDGADDHAVAVNRAHAFLKDNAVAIKVLPVKFRELLNLLKIDYDDFMRRGALARNDPESIAFEKACIERLMQIVGNEHAEPRVRTDAFNLLRQAGKIHD